MDFHKTATKITDTTSCINLKPAFHSHEKGTDELAENFVHPTNSFGN